MERQKHRSYKKNDFYERKRKDTRLLHINDEVWEYKIGKINIMIISPNGTRYFPNKFDDIESEYYNPAEIKYYIQTKILKIESSDNRCVSCHNIKSDVSLRVNPFNAEIFGDNTQHFLCDRCSLLISYDI